MSTMTSLELREQVARAIAGKRAGGSGWIRANCPACAGRQGRADRRMSLGVNARSGKFGCFRCGARGKLEGAHYAEEAPPAAAAAPAFLEPPESYVPLFEGPGRTAMSLAGARDYVRSRPGFDESTARAAQIGACTSGRMAGRVVIPVLDEVGRWRWYVGRSWVPKCDKPYLYPFGDRRGVLYNAKAARVETDVPLLLVEGAFDAIAHWPDAAAVLGKPTDDHIKLLAETLKRPICVVLDGDATDEAMAVAYDLIISGCTRVGLLGLAPRVDPDEIGRDVLRRLAIKACAGKLPTIDADDEEEIHEAAQSRQRLIAAGDSSRDIANEKRTSPSQVSTRGKMPWRAA